MAASRVLVTSPGLWRRRRDLATLFDAPVRPFAGNARASDVVAGWGERPSGLRARSIVERSGARLAVLEDGFLAGYAPLGRPGGDVPLASYTLDTRAAHYDAARESDLESAIEADDFTPAELERAERAMALLRTTRLSKYNAAPLVEPGELGLERPFVLLLEQVEGDRSLEGAGADAFAAMLEAARETHPDHDLAIRAHPAARGTGPLARIAASFGARVVDRGCNPWPLLEAASRVWTHSSHAGFEALVAGTPVTCFGRPFYAGWGLTEDRAVFPRRAARPSLATVFAAAYLRASRYLDIHDRRETTLEATIEALAALRDARAANRGRLVTVGFSPWRRRAAAPFLVGPGGAPIHRRTLAGALRERPDTLVVWGTRTVDAPPGIAVVRMEDGFVRSRGLGAALRMPLSLVRETGDHLHFDARGPSGVERTLGENPPGEAECARARALGQRIVALDVSKYMLDGAGTLPETDREKVLVVGQVEDDASIRLGAPEVFTNSALLAKVRTLFPEAFIAYRDHPDVASGLRHGRASREHVDADVDGYAITALLEWCDRVETMTSLTGFEALLRGKAVGTHGRPFYAGWGLTDDRLVRPPRGTASLDALTAATLLRYPLYIHPASRLPCSPERAVEAIASPPPPRATERWLLHPAGLALGRIKHLARQKSR